ncbi:hypothetical protein QBC38DRAFT_371401 [Podospora fimiseda]|uniref:Uncharacterized protein n=1 Tax=Podospora fimiseda TaxID=252190 RepID=A0AAN7BJ61_9PEZI|nr:hypothetical protein QBC38DRAFT_371401 [Podospora fimiseda]
MSTASDSPTPPPITGADVYDIHKDLTSKYNKYKKRIAYLWSNMDASQRAEYMQKTAPDNKVLLSPADTSLGDLNKLVPDWNVRDVARDPKVFLDILKHRTGNELVHQYLFGPDGPPGDYDYIIDMIETGQLQPVNPEADMVHHHLRELTFTMNIRYIGTPDMKTYPLEKNLQRGLLVCQSYGEVILKRQFYLLQAIDGMVDAILDIYPDRE